MGSKRAEVGRLLSLGILILCGFLFGIGSLVADDKVPNKLNPLPKSFARPILIKFSGEIDYRRTAYLRSKLIRARDLKADLIVVEIDSPGGLKDESLELAEQLRDIDWAYTVAYIPREAISGAALIALGADQIIADPDARIGDIGVIGFDPQAFAFRFAEAKIFSVLVRQARDICESKGRPPALAEAMIDKDVLVYRRVDDQGRAEYMTRRVEPNKAPEQQIDGGWQLIPESGPERFLTLSGARAKELGLAQGTADSIEELKQQLGIEAEFRVIAYTLADSLVYWLNTPLLTALLIIIGLVALYTELAAPGIGAGALIAALCALLFFGSRFLGGTSGLLEVLLFLAGIGFLLMEIFVIPGWGISGLMGIVLMMVSAIMAGQNFVWPSTEREWQTLLTSLAVLLGSTFVVLILAGHITRRLGSIPLINRLVLAVPSAERADLAVDKESDKPRVPAHPLVSVGDWGIADSLLRPAGRARFGRTIIDVISDGSFIDPGKQIRVTQIEGNRVVVVAIDENKSTAHA